MPEVYFRVDGRILKGSYELGDPGKLDFNIPFSLKDEFKASVSNARWNPTRKTWSADDNFRTHNILKFLAGENIYAQYDLPLIDFEPTRPELYSHQRMMCRHILTRHYAVLAAEMGTGKTLATVEVLEAAKRMYGVGRWWYVAPRSALESVKYDYGKWKAKVIPQFMTYEEMVRVLGGWDSNVAPPEGVIFDESSRVKTANAQRTQAALHLANHIREYYKERGFVILMSGSPAPKSPVDWWSQCEIAYPGFLREGTPEKFRERIALMRMEENAGGIKYPKLICYRDSEKRCNVCGKFQDSEIHKQDTFASLTFVAAGQNMDQQPHEFRPMTDEISIMHKRMTGLVLVQFKKDCLDLPEKVYRTIELKPTAHMKRLAKMVQKSAPTTAQALILLRELSDGFQYHDRKIGVSQCEYCLDDKGNGTGIQKYYEEVQPDPENYYTDDPQCDVLREAPVEKVLKERSCPHCSGKGHRDQWEKVTVECDSPKLQAFKDILEDKEEDGRLIVFAGFTGTIERLCATVVGLGGKTSKKWNYIRVDGKGWQSDLGISDPQRLIQIFQEGQNEYPNVVFIGHPGSAGMGLTLTASDTTLYYSNDFNAESRVQSEDRTHRPGSRGCNIIDLVHLPVDRLVIENLKMKRDLMRITMGDLDKALED